MQLIGLARLGKDAELRFTGDGTPVASLSLAFNYGKKDNQGKRPTQWVDGSLWGDRAESLIDHLKKGTALVVYLEDPHIETYQKNGGGEGYKLAARVASLEFAGSSNDNAQRQQGQGQAPAQRPSAPGNQPAQRQAAPRPAPAPSKTGFDDDMDGDIPFN